MWLGRLRATFANCRNDCTRTERKTSHFLSLWQNVADELRWAMGTSDFLNPAHFRRLRSERSPLFPGWAASGWTSAADFNSVSKQDDYLDRAAQTVDLATRTSSSGDRSQLLDLAKRWRDLADRSRDHAAPSPHEHPLVKRAFRGLP
jgi:hypothetical protein